MKLTPEQLLLRWFNYHLRAAKHPKKVTNFGGDVKDSTAYSVLLKQLGGGAIDNPAKVLGMSDMTERGQCVLDNAKKLNVNAFIKAKDIAAGNPRLNLAFTAAIFNMCPGLDPLTKEESDKAGLDDEDLSDSREERAFRMWINSLGIPGVYLNNLFDDLCDGLALLKTIDKIEPGLVEWKKAELKANNVFKKCSNNNYAVTLGLGKPLQLSLVNIGGSDIVAGNKKLILGFVWQLMRFHTIKFLKEVQASQFGGAQVTDAMLIDRANQIVATTGKTGHEATMRDFKDARLKNGLFFLNFLRAIRSDVIDDQYVTTGDNDADCLLNARYAISVARKLGATLFLIPEDIVEVKPKMLMTFTAALLALYKPTK